MEDLRYIKICENHWPSSSFDKIFQGMCKTNFMQIKYNCNKNRVIFKLSVYLPSFVLDIDECSSASLFTCPLHMKCNNTIGGYSCIPDIGYEYSPPGYSYPVIGMNLKYFY